MSKTILKQSFEPLVGSESVYDDVVSTLVELSEQETNQVGGGPEVENDPNSHQ